MSYDVFWHQEALAELREIGKGNIERKVLREVNESLAMDPLTLGDPLANGFGGLFRYRYWKIWVLYAVDREQRQVFILETGYGGKPAAAAGR